MTEKEQIVTAESRSLHEVVADYSYALDLLDQYDYHEIEVEAVSGPPRFRATYKGAMEAIHSLKERFGGSPLFGNEKDGSFRSSIGQIYQTFDGRELYPSAEEKAGHAALFSGKEPFVQRWQQAYCRDAVSVVYVSQRPALPNGWQQAHRGQHIGGAYADDRMQSRRGERPDGAADGLPDQCKQ